MTDFTRPSLYLYQPPPPALSSPFPLYPLPTSNIPELFIFPPSTHPNTTRAMDTTIPIATFGGKSLLSTSLLLVAPRTPTDIYGQACSRVKWLTGSVLPGDMAAALNSLLSVIHTFLTDNNDPTPHPLLAQIASPELLSDQALSAMANVVKTGLEDFASASGRPKSEIARDSTLGAPHAASTVAPESRRQFLREQCGKRDNTTCCLTRCSTSGECCSIFPFIEGVDGAANFWRLISLLCGQEETAALRVAISLDPDMVPGTDMLSNLWWISNDLHKYFARGWVVVVPQLTLKQLPYDPATIRQVSPMTHL